MAALFDISWIDADWPMQRQPGYGEQALPLSSLFDLAPEEKGKPALVYISRALDEEERLELEQRLFGREDLVMGTRFFRCYRIDESWIKDEKVREEYAKKLPALILLDSKGEEFARLTGPVAARSLYARMERLYRDVYGDRLGAQIRRIADVLDEIQKSEDTLADLAYEIDTLKQRIEDNDSKSAERNLAKKTKELEEEQKRFEELMVRFDEMVAAPAVESSETAAGD